MGHDSRVLVSAKEARIRWGAKVERIVIFDIHTVNRVGLKTLNATVRLLAGDLSYCSIGILKIRPADLLLVLQLVYVQYLKDAHFGKKSLFRQIF